MLYIFLAIFLVIGGGINFILILKDIDLCEADINKLSTHIVLMFVCLIMCGFNIARIIYC